MSVVGINLIDTVTINDGTKDISFHPSEIPIISIATSVLLPEFSYFFYERPCPLRQQVDTLVDLTHKLEDAREHKTRHRIFGVLRAALTVAIVVGGILGTIALKSSPVGIVLGIFATLGAYITMACINACHLPEMTFKDKKGGGIVLAFFLAPFIPIYETFRAESRFQFMIANLRRDITEQFKRSSAFFKQDLSRLQDILQKNVEYMGWCLVSHPPVYPRYFADKKANYELALKELGEAIAFYTKV